MRIAVTGTTGRVGAALAHHLAADHDVVPLPRCLFDLGDPEALAAALADLECDVFLNPAGLTSLEACEEDPTAAQRLNAAAPAEIAAWASNHGIRMVHFSTDYVFRGEHPGLRNEISPTGPLSVYGKTKVAGESAVLSHPDHCVLRVSWVFGPEKPSFIDRVFDEALAGRPLAAVADKFSLPVHTRDLAEWVAVLLERRATGLIHACQSGEAASWHDMAVTVVTEMVACGVLAELPLVATKSMHEMTGFRAPRPVFSAMDTSRLAGHLGAPPRQWREAVADYVCNRCSAL